MDTKNKAAIQSKLEKMFKRNKKFFAIIFENGSPTTTTQVVVTKKDNVEIYFLSMKDSGLIDWFAVSEKYPNGDWSIAFTMKSTGILKHMAKIKTLQYCQI